MIDLAPHDLAEVRRILRAHVPGVEVRAFGSRVTGKAERYSDLDLALVGSERMDLRAIEALRDAFAESDLPIQVDVLDWHALSEAFREIVTRGYEIVQQQNVSSPSA